MKIVRRAERTRREKELSAFERHLDIERIERSAGPPHIISPKLKQGKVGKDGGGKKGKDGK